MNKIIYTNQDGIVSIVSPASKACLEKTRGPMTDLEYENHIIDRVLLSNGITDFRFISEEDIPSSREFREAWVDSEPGTQIDICCEKARDIALERLRSKRNKELVQTDAQFVEALSKGQDTSALVLEKQRLRDLTNDLKAMDVVGKVNDTAVLDAIKVAENKE